MIKKMLLSMWLIPLFVLGAVGAAQAEVRIKGVSLSTRLLLDIYKAYEQESSLASLDPNVLIMTVESTVEVPSWAIEVKIFDGTQWVAATDIGVAALKKGFNRYNASQFDVTVSQPKYNEAYQPSFNVETVASGNILPISNFKIVITPKPPQSGPPYILTMGLFAPRSAVNRPPVPIYPRDMAINSALPNFSWMPANGAKSYAVVVGPEIDPEINAYWRSRQLTGTQITYPGPARALQTNKKYFWKVIAYDGVGKPVGGALGQSQVAWFKINSATKSGARITPQEADRIVRRVIKDEKILTTLNNYQAVAVTGSSDDLADLLQQLQAGTAKIISQRLE